MNTTDTTTSTSTTEKAPAKISPERQAAQSIPNDALADSLRKISKSVNAFPAQLRDEFVLEAAERIEKIKARTPRVEQKVRYLHDGKAMPDSQNKLSSVCYFYGKTADGRKMSTDEFRAFLAEHGVGDLNEPGFRCKLPTGVEITTIAIDAPIPAAPAKPAKATTPRKSSTSTTKKATAKKAPAKSAPKKATPAKQTPGAKKRAEAAKRTGKSNVTPIPKKATANR